MPSIAHAVYFYFSLFFLVGRTLAVSLYLADINDKSKQTLMIIRHVPEESWCTELMRFSHEIRADLMVLTGMKFFNVTRKLVLTVRNFMFMFILDDEDVSLLGGTSTP